MFGSDVIDQVLDSIKLPSTIGRLVTTFPYRFDATGQAIRWVTPHSALLVFLKRMRTRGSVLVHLQSFFGRSVGWISEVFNAVVMWLKLKWFGTKIDKLDSRVFNRWRLQDYADCLWRNGFWLPGVVGFVDGTFHSTYRPGADGYDGALQRAFYSGAKKGHGLVFEMITFADGMIGRAFGPVAGRHHDLYLAAQSGLRHLIEFGSLRGFRLFGDKAYVGFGDLVLHPFIGALEGSIQAAWNTYTSAYRIEVEHNIGNIYMRCAILQREMCLDIEIPEEWFKAGVLLQNIHTCVYRGNQTALRFGMPPPWLSEYMQE